MNNNSAISVNVSEYTIKFDRIKNADFPAKNKYFGPNRFCKTFQKKQAVIVSCSWNEDSTLAKDHFVFLDIGCSEKLKLTIEDFIGESILIELHMQEHVFQGYTKFIVKEGGSIKVNAKRSTRNFEEEELNIYEEQNIYDITFSKENSIMYNVHSYDIRGDTNGQ